MTDPTAIPSDDDERRTEDEVASDADAALDDGVAPEEEQLDGWLPEATPSEGPAPAP